LATTRSELTKTQELIYELRVREVMSADLITVPPDCSIQELKEMLRINRISGVPVVADDRMVGVISMETLIRALEQGQLDTIVADKMTTDVVTLRDTDTVASAVNLFARYGYGRFPVLDADDKLVGILTQSDILRGLLHHLEKQWQTEELRRYRASHIFEDIESDRTTLLLHYWVKARDFLAGGAASSKIKRALDRLGARPTLLRRVAVATYEAETNVMIHSVGGEIIAEVRPNKVIVTAKDEGPGIPDIEQALQPGFSTASNIIRELGFGAGMGLSNIKSCTDEMSLESEMGVGTELKMVFRLQTTDKGAP